MELTQYHKCGEFATNLPFNYFFGQFPTIGIWKFYGWQISQDKTSCAIITQQFAEHLHRLFFILLFLFFIFSGHFQSKILFIHSQCPFSFQGSAVFCNSYSFSMNSFIWAARILGGIELHENTDTKRVQITMTSSLQFPSFYILRNLLLLLMMKPFWRLLEKQLLSRISVPSCTSEGNGTFF